MSTEVSMLSKHSSRRDQYGIPIPFPCPRAVPKTHTLEQRQKIQEWNSAQAELQELVTKLTNIFEEIAFVEHWLLPLLNPAKETHDTKAHQSTDTENDVALSLEMRELKQKERNAIAKWHHLKDVGTAALSYTLDGMGDHYPRHKDDTTYLEGLTLIRVWTDKSHTYFSEDFGFQCSNRSSSQPAKSLDELLSKQVLTPSHLQQHCGGSGNPSNWISLFNDASRALRFVENQDLWDDPSCMVAVISVDKLERCGILWDHSDNLVRRSGGTARTKNNPGGVKNAYARHVLVHGWIPAQCILNVFTVEEFGQRCDERYITESKQKLPAVK
jgi:hypothetical protein